jgi:hypothetical protein
MRVCVSGEAQLALADEPSDFCTGTALPVEEADPAVTKRVT